MRMEKKYIHGGILLFRTPPLRIAANVILAANGERKHTPASVGMREPERLRPGPALDTAPLPGLPLNVRLCTGRMENSTTAFVRQTQKATENKQTQKGGIGGEEVKHASAVVKLNNVEQESENLQHFCLPAPLLA